MLHMPKSISSLNQLSSELRLGIRDTSTQTSESTRRFFLVDDEQCPVRSTRTIEEAPVEDTNWG
jgi:hypothetical protein